ncbi:MAG: hypothetical protein ACLUFW_05970 [Alistipes sp.]
MILKEEVSTDSLLSCLAEEDVNEMAAARAMPALRAGKAEPPTRL